MRKNREFHQLVLGKNYAFSRSVMENNSKICLLATWKKQRSPISFEKISQNSSIGRRKISQNSSNCNGQNSRDFSVSREEKIVNCINFLQEAMKLVKPVAEKVAKFVSRLRKEIAKFVDLSREKHWNWPISCGKTLREIHQLVAKKFCEIRQTITCICREICQMITREITKFDYCS